MVDRTESKTEIKANVAQTVSTCTHQNHPLTTKLQIYRSFMFLGFKLSHSNVIRILRNVSRTFKKKKLGIKFLVSGRLTYFLWGRGGRSTRTLNIGLTFEVDMYDAIDKNLLLYIFFLYKLLFLIIYSFIILLRWIHYFFLSLVVQYVLIAGNITSATTQDKGGPENNNN